MVRGLEAASILARKHVYVPQAVHGTRQNHTTLGICLPAAAAYESYLLGNACHTIPAHATDFKYTFFFLCHKQLKLNLLSKLRFYMSFNFLFVWGQAEPW